MAKETGSKVTSITNGYARMDDDALAARAQAGDRGAEAVLLERYRYLAHVKSKGFFLSGAEHQDTVQEGMIGLFKAIRDYRPGAGCKFRSFAIIVVTRQIITAVKTHGRGKHTPLSYYTGLTARDDDGEVLERLDVSEKNADVSTNPLEALLHEEDVRGAIRAMKATLTSVEWDVWIRNLEGMSYSEIARDLGCKEKTVDNALCRIRKKAQYYAKSA